MMTCPKDPPQVKLVDITPLFVVWLWSLCQPCCLLLCEIVAASLVPKCDGVPLTSSSHNHFPIIGHPDPAGAHLKFCLADLFFLTKRALLLFGVTHDFKMPPC